MNYPIKTLNQLPLLIKGFRKENGLTQAAMAEKLGIAQQSYAHFEANPDTATLERLFMVLRLLDVEILLDQASPATSKGATSSVEITSQRPTTAKAVGQKAGNSPSAAVVNRKTKPSTVAKAARIAPPTRKKESW